MENFRSSRLKRSIFDCVIVGGLIALLLIVALPEMPGSNDEYIANLDLQNLIRIDSSQTRSKISLLEEAPSIVLPFADENTMLLFRSQGLLGEHSVSVLNRYGDVVEVLPLYSTELVSEDSSFSGAAVISRAGMHSRVRRADDGTSLEVRPLTGSNIMRMARSQGEGVKKAHLISRVSAGERDSELSYLLRHGDFHVELPKKRTSQRSPSMQGIVSEKANGSGLQIVEMIAVATGDFSAGMSNDEVVSQVYLSVLSANEYLEATGLKLKLVAVQVLRAGDDPYEYFYQGRDIMGVLRQGISEWSGSSTPKRDVVVVFNKRHFPGGVGLAYPSVSCLYPDYSVIAITQGGELAVHRENLGDTLAHEVGHYVGMSHDNSFYPLGRSVMASTVVSNPFGFSERSLAELSNHAGENMRGSSCFHYEQFEGEGGDLDGDGASDSEELEFGTDPIDAGSFPEALRSPVHATWNGFLGVTNILELSNPTSFDTELKLTLFSLAGERVHHESFRLGPLEQRDVILNQLPGFRRNSYGLLEVEFEGELDGRTSYYKNREDGRGGFEFVYSMALTRPVKGKSVVGFNTFQVDRSPERAHTEVVNWLTLVNLDSVARKFFLRSYDQGGRLLLFNEVWVPAMGRADVDGGHGFKKQMVGLHEIIPADASTSYLGFIVRYGEGFAFPLLSRAGSGRPMVLPISSRSGEENWVELANALRTASSVQIEVYGESGELFSESQHSLPPHGQYHFDASKVLRDSSASFGHVRLLPESRGSVVSQSMFYFRDDAGERVDSLFGSQAKEPLSYSLSGSYNLYLGVENELLISNPTDVGVQATMTVKNSGSEREIELVFAPGESKVVALTKIGSLSLAQNTYGVLTLKGNAPLYSSLLRRKESPESLEFIFPTEVR